MEIPRPTIQLIQGELKEEYSNFCEELVEPMSGAPPTNLCIARILSPVTLGKEVVLQVMNISQPTLITIYKGMKLGKTTSRHDVMVVDDNINNVVATQTDQSQASDFNFDCSNLTYSEKTKLQNLLTPICQFICA